MYLNNRPKRPSKTRKITSPKGLFVFFALIVLAIIIGGGWLLTQKNNGSPSKQPSAQQAAKFDKTQYSLTDPASPWLVVNKKRPLSPKNYAPADLTAPQMAAESAEYRVNSLTSSALAELSSAAAKDGLELVVASAYRSYSEQSTIYNSMVRGFGQEQADRESARPGHSEHQTGWAADLGAKSGKCRIETCFGDTREGKWLVANAYKYGFIIRYPKGKEHITGYNYEPWHLRYVGKKLATEMRSTGIQTLEEFFGLPSAASY